MELTRVENKYFVNKKDISGLVSILSSVCKVDPYCQDCKPYELSSIYFDNFTDDDLFEKIQGVNFREKYRIRLYNKNLSSAKFEIKRKNHNTIQKLGTQIDQDALAKLLDGDFLPLRDRSEFGYVEQKLRLENYRPKAIVTYKRLAFYLPFDNIRVTLDLDIRGSLSNKVSIDSIHDYGIHLMPENYDVLELKFEGSLPLFLTRLLSSFSLRQASISKYVLARFHNNPSPFEDRGELPF